MKKSANSSVFAMANLPVSSSCLDAQLARQRGFTLIEVLVALVIFAIGLLAVAGLQLSSLRATQYANQMVVGTSFVREYGELMQLIPSATSATYKVQASTQKPSFYIDTSVASGRTASECTGASKKCDVATMVNAMKDDWARRVATQLPVGRAVVCRDNTAADANGDYAWGDCSNEGETMRVKIGWASKSMGPSSQDMAQGWMTADRPRMVVTVMGNPKDYVNQDAAAPTP